MKRLTSYWLKPFEFTAAAHAELKPTFEDKTDAFLQAIAEECVHYVEGVKADVPRQAIGEWRDKIERIGATVAAAADAIRSLDEDCARLLDQGLVLETRRLGAREVALKQLDELARAAARAAAFPELNPKEGAPVDFDKRRLARACAAAYIKATGKAPKPSPNGTFARVLLIVMRAVRAVPQSQTSISKTFLESVLTVPRRKVTAPITR